MSDEMSAPYGDIPGFWVNRSNIRITHGLDTQTTVILCALIVVLVICVATVTYSLSRMKQLEGRVDDHAVTLQQNFDARVVQVESSMAEKTNAINTELRSAAVAADLKKFNLEEARVNAQVASALQTALLAQRGDSCRMAAAASSSAN